MADDKPTTDTPIGDQVAAEQTSPPIEPGTTPEQTPVVDDEPVDTEDTFDAIDGSERPKYGEHDGRFYATFTVAGVLDDTQLAQCAGNVRLHAVNNGYRPTDNSHDVITLTGDHGKPVQVIVSVPVEANTVANQAAAAEQDDVPEQRETSES